jgi:two-component system NtrC family response regulator
VLARAIHQWSPRDEHPFIAVNCTALSPELLESELFGHERGAFTGAIAQKKGKFELADGGTIFLDEIGDLALSLQVKLLRVLQEREFQRVGGIREIRADVRILAATNRNLQQAMQNGSFREDLFYRLNVVSITLPALRDRTADIPALVKHFLEHSCREMKRPQLGIDRSVMDILQSHPWPGNVRELQNAIERAVVLAAGPDIIAADLPAEIRPQILSSHNSTEPLARSTNQDGSQVADQIAALDDSLSLAEAVQEFKRLRIRHILDRTEWNQTEAAKLLGLPQSNLSRLMKRLQVR